MIICVCKSINDRELSQLIDNGASTVRDVARKCEAGTECGSCACDIRQMIAARSVKMPPFVGTLPRT